MSTHNICFCGQIRKIQALSGAIKVFFFFFFCGGGGGGGGWGGVGVLGSLLGFFGDMPHIKNTAGDKGFFLTKKH